MRKSLLIVTIVYFVLLHNEAFGQTAGWTGDTSNTTTPAKVGVFMPSGTPAAFPLHVHVGPNANFFVRPGSDWPGGGGASIDALNDALNVRLPMFIGGNPIVLTGGNVGIGTVSPNDKLEVWGNARF